MCVYLWQKFFSFCASGNSGTGLGFRLDGWPFYVGSLKWRKNCREFPIYPGSLKLTGSARAAWGLRSVKNTLVPNASGDHSIIILDLGRVNVVDLLAAMLLANPPNRAVVVNGLLNI